MILFILRSIGAVVAGIAAAFILVIAFEFFGSIVHPLPEGFDKESFEEMCRHVARYPHWVLGMAVGAWGLAAFAGTWIAGRLGNRASAAVLGLLLLSMVILNISMLPYPIWFKFASVVVVAAASTCGYRLSSRRASVAAHPDPERRNFQ